MRLLAILLIGLVGGLAIGYVLANNLLRSGAAGLPMAVFEGSPCAARIERQIAFTAPDAQDTMTIQSSGPSCANVVANVTVRDTSGHIVFAYAARIDALMDPKVNPVAANGVKAILADYAAMAEGGAHTALPDWTADTPDIANIAPYTMFNSIASDALYRKVRDSNAPILRLRDGRSSGLLFAYVPEIDESELIAHYAL